MKVYKNALINNKRYYYYQEDFIWRIQGIQELISQTNSTQITY